jgi:hypothetical protein
MSIHLFAAGLFLLGQVLTAMGIGENYRGDFS